MYIPAQFRETHLDILHRVVRDYSFGTLVSLLRGQLFATHLPFLLEDTRGPNGTLVGHMARANPHWQGFEPGAESLVIFQGPHTYVSPRWYRTELNVPTWNYVAVHAYGTASILDDPTRVRRLLEATVGTFEAGLPGEAWSIDRVPGQYVANLARAIVAFEIPISRLEGKRKLSQNRQPEDVAGAVDGLLQQSDPLQLEVAELMREANPS